MDMEERDPSSNKANNGNTPAGATQVEPTKNKNTIILISLFIVIVLVGIGIFLFIQNQQKNTSNNTENETNQTENTDESEDETSIEEDSELAEGFEKYINEEWGYSIDYPKEFMHEYGECILTEGSYRPERAVIPTTILESTDKSSVYITNEYSYVLAGETVNSDNTSDFSECNKTTTTIEDLNVDLTFPFVYWEIKAEEVPTEDYLETIIKDQYGSGCMVGSVDATDEDDIYNVIIKGDGLDILETKCPINFQYEMRFNKKTGVVVFWNVGQSITFLDELGSEGYDQQMIDSFRFID